MDRARAPKKTYSLEERKAHIEAFKASGVTKAEYCARNQGLAYTTFTSWVQAYEVAGDEGLLTPAMYVKQARGKKRGPKGIPPALKDEIKRTKLENPTRGARGLRNILARLRGVKVSANTIQKTLKAENLELVAPKKRRRSARPLPRRFERALPMQLWQSDITSMVLTRHSVRVYLTVFLDDRSRYIVSWNLQLRQTTDLVINALLRGVERFGKPEEVLTDQGRQYFAWRGRSEFELLLRKEGIKHVVARSHHPQTVGKCERFWETVKEEFWERVKPQDLKDAQTRFQHFVNYYNHFRPHQGIDGMVPADRFFGVENDLRKALERTYAANELKLALGEKPRTPVFLIGQIGNESISLHGEGGKLIVNTHNGERKELEYEHFGHRGSEEGTQAVGKAGALMEGATGSAETNQGALGELDGGGSKEGARDGDGDHGILAGAGVENGSVQAIGDAADPGVAAVAEGDLGYASGAAGAAESEGRDGECSRRPEGTQKADRGAGGDGEDAGAADLHSEADARDLRGEEE
jgi:transposase InsO family protein